MRHTGRCEVVVPRRRQGSKACHDKLCVFSYKNKGIQHSPTSLGLLQALGIHRIPGAGKVSQFIGNTCISLPNSKKTHNVSDFLCIGESIGFTAFVFKRCLPYIGSLVPHRHQVASVHRNVTVAYLPSPPPHHNTIERRDLLFCSICPFVR